MQLLFQCNCTRHYCTCTLNLTPEPLVLSFKLTRTLGPSRTWSATALAQGLETALRHGLGFRVYCYCYCCYYCYADYLLFVLMVMMSSTLIVGLGIEGLRVRV